MAGTFHASSQDIRIDWQEGNQTILLCQARDESGNLQDARIRLDDYIGNDNGNLNSIFHERHLLIFLPGNFVWDGEDFSHSARNVSVQIEQGGNVVALHAELENREGNWVRDVLNLGERIINDNGCLVFRK